MTYDRAARRVADNRSAAPRVDYTPGDRSGDPVAVATYADPKARALNADSETLAAKRALQPAQDQPEPEPKAARSKSAKA